METDVNIRSFIISKEEMKMYFNSNIINKTDYIAYIECKMLEKEKVV